jgi:hypothetical protein
MRPHLSIRLAAIAAAASSLALAADQPSAADLEFFETKVRPVLAKNCYGCHASDIKSPMGGLFLDSKNGVRKGGKSGPAVVPGDPDASLLIRAVRYQGPKMPPAGQLSETVVADLVKWVEMGAPDPREATVSAAPPSIDIEKGRQYWAFQAPVKSAPPKVKNAKWPLAPEDRFVLARMEKERLVPVADVDRTAWIRRVTLDLIGLPPTLDEIDAFLADHSKTAYAKVADRLLASPRFGERWGRHWLDVARYADTIGRGRNYPFPFAWRYRDWVIDAFNHDMPYDQFVREQVAGDLLPSTTAKQHNEQLIASGFLALGSHDLVERNPEVFLMDRVDEQVNATSRAFMGVTVGCARCHDHKFDPIPTTDYYAMAGIFKSTAILSGLQNRPRDNSSYFNVGLLAKMTHDASDPETAFPPDPKDRAEWDRLQSELAEINQAPRKALVKLGLVGKGQQANANQQQKLRQVSNQIQSQLDRFGLPPDMAMAVRDESSAADCEVYIKGEVNDLGPKVPRGFPQVMSAPGAVSVIGASESGRLELAQWLTRRDNPTTARVAVNRIWQHLFGRGIVSSSDNFGKMGEKPVNQPLLDYLAVRFMDQGWSTKKMIRELVLSRTYRLSTAASPRDEKLDPGNVYLWRANRERLEIEPIRDSLLMIAGQLDLTPPETSPAMNFRRSQVVGGGGRGGATQDFADTMRNRTVYVPVVRNFLPPMFETFDFPEPSETKGVREVTTVPTQALFLMNSRFVIDQARHAAERLLSANLATPQERVTRAYREVLGRMPTAAEMNRAMIFVHSAQEESDSQPAPEAPVMAGRANGFRPAQRGGRGGRGPGETPLAKISPEASAWEHLYQALFASAEFRYRS